MSAFQPWVGSHFKSEEPTRYERKREAKAAEEKQWREVCAAVDARDHRRCRSCGCGFDPNAKTLLDRPHRHHITLRSAIGPDESWNVVCLCAGCHNDIHRERLRVEGNADVALTFHRSLRAGEWFIARQETAPHVLTARD